MHIITCVNNKYSISWQNKLRQTFHVFTRQLDSCTAALFTALSPSSPLFWLSSLKFLSDQLMILWQGTARKSLIVHVNRYMCTWTLTDRRNCLNWNIEKNRKLWNKWQSKRILYKIERVSNRIPVLSSNSSAHRDTTWNKMGGVRATGKNEGKGFFSLFSHYKKKNSKHRWCRAVTCGKHLAMMTGKWSEDHLVVLVIHTFKMTKKTTPKG